MRHADDDFFHAIFAGVLDKVVQACNRAFAALYREAFLPNVFGVQIAFQRFGGGDLFEQIAFFVCAEMRRGQIALKALAYP